MALEKGFTDESGVEHPQAYWLVRRVRLDFDMNVADILFRCWHNADAEAAGMAPLARTVTMRIAPTAQDGLPSFETVAIQLELKAGARAYLYSLAKTLPELAGSVDV